MKAKSKTKQLSESRLDKKIAKIKKLIQEDDRHLTSLEKSNLEVRAAFVKFALTFGRLDWINSKTLPPRRF